MGLSNPVIPPPPGGACPPGFTGTPPNCVMGGGATPAPTPGGPAPLTKVPVTRNPARNINAPNYEPPPGLTTPQVPKPRNPDQMPCGPGFCKDTVTGECRSFNPNREKVNMTDTWERSEGPDWAGRVSDSGGRGYCRKKNGGGAGGPAPMGGALGGGPGAGGPGAGGAGGPAPTGSSAGANDFASMLERYLREGLTSPSRYTPEVMQALHGQVTRQADGQIQRGQRDVRANAARNNMSRAGAVQAGLRSVRDVAEGQRGAANVGIMQAKINADYEDRIAGLDRSQRYLDSLRDNEYRYSLMGEQRRQYDANLTLAYANIANQRQMLREQLRHQVSMQTSSQQAAMDRLLAGGGIQNLS